MLRLVIFLVAFADPAPALLPDVTVEGQRIHEERLERVSLAAYTWQLWSLGRVPPLYSLACYRAASMHGADRIELAGYLVSEHGDNWTRDVTKCSKEGACGPFQLTAWVEGEFGFPRRSRQDPWLSAELAAQELERAKRKTSEERATWDWRGRVKCKRAWRPKCGAIRSWKRYERAIASGIGRFVRR